MGLTLANSNDEVPDRDYEVILLAIKETARGRAFLAEYPEGIFEAHARLVSINIDGAFDD